MLVKCCELSYEEILFFSVYQYINISSRLIIFKFLNIGSEWDIYGLKLTTRTAFFLCSRFTETTTMEIRALLYYSSPSSLSIVPLQRPSPSLLFITPLFITLSPSPTFHYPSLHHSSLHHPSLHHPSLHHPSLHYIFLSPFLYHPFSITHLYHPLSITLSLSPFLYQPL